jgi:hypothetical protein
MVGNPSITMVQKLHGLPRPVPSACALKRCFGLDASEEVIVYDQRSPHEKKIYCNKGFTNVKYAAQM